VITDNVGMKADSVWASVVSTSDYYPFGLEMKGRSFTDTTFNYRYGFNGKEKDNFNATVYDYGFRIYNPEIAKFLSVDPLTATYPELTPYQFASNTPVQAIDLDGLERLDMTDVSNTSRTAKITIVKSVNIVTAGLVTELASLKTGNFSSRFKNTTLYSRNIPQNGLPVDFITAKDYKNGIGYALNVSFDVKLNYISASVGTPSGPEHSTLTMAPSGSGFKSNMSFAQGSTNNDNTIKINPSFDAFSVNSGISILENYEELIAHEAGFHNMMGKLHLPNSAGTAAVYPSTKTLESNIHGQIISNDDDVKEMIKTNVNVDRI
jgi:RHS repeat-associated protein